MKYTPSDDVINVDHSYGVDFEGPVSLEHELAIDTILLLQFVNIMRKSTSFGALEVANCTVNERT